MNKYDNFFKLEQRARVLFTTQKKEGLLGRYLGQAPINAKLIPLKQAAA